MNYISREEICEYLNPIYDLERLIGRISYKTANPRDLISFKNSLEMLPYIKDLMGEFTTPLLKELWEELDPLEDVHDLVSRAIVDDPPVSLRDGRNHQRRLPRGDGQAAPCEDGRKDVACTAGVQGA